MTYSVNNIAYLPKYLGKQACANSGDSDHIQKGNRGSPPIYEAICSLEHVGNYYNNDDLVFYIPFNII